MAESDSERSLATSSSQNGRRLDSWKEIAAYLNRDVTTVRRWEKREGLPVHRHRHAALGSVYAFTIEIDTWRFGRERPDQPEPTPPNTVRPVLVGRASELRRLQTHLSQAVDGARRMVFIAGELGMGKTALTQTFLDLVRSDVWIAAGQCVEHFGLGEPYLPVIEGLERLCRDPSHRDGVRVVEDHAPSWLDQIRLPSRAGQPSRRGRSPRPNLERMAGELTDAIEALTALKPLVVLLEDLHWSDHSTVALIAKLGRRVDRARLLLIGTYRPAELFDSGSPLLRVCRELCVHFQADEIELPLLTQEAIAEFIARDRTWSDLAGTAAWLRQWSGNPLFLVHLLEHLEGSGHIVERSGEWALDLEPLKRGVVPHTLRTLVEEQVDRLDLGNRRLLEIASVIGEVFPAALVADAAQQDVSLVEQSLDDLCRRSHLVSHRDDAVWPDGTCSAAYAFGHEFYRQVVYERLPSATLADWHRHVAERLELAHGDRAQEISSELATHFDRGRDFERAVRHYGVAAENALARSADREAQIGLSKACELVVQLRRGDQRDRLEHQLRTQLGDITRGLSTTIQSVDTDVGDQFLLGSASVDGAPELVDGLIGLSRFQAVVGDLQAAREIGDRSVAVAKAVNRHLFEAIAQQAFVRLLAGEFVTSRSLALAALSVADREGVPSTHQERARCSVVHAWSAWYLGRYDELRQALERILDGADKQRHTTSPTRPDTSIAPLLEWLGETDRSLSLFGTHPNAPEQSGLVHGVWPTNSIYGWLLVRRGRLSDGLAVLRESEGSLRRLGVHAGLPQTLAWLAEGLKMNGQFEDARLAAEDGLNIVRRTGARCCDAELHRLRSEAMSASGLVAPGAAAEDRNRDAAEASFWAGISVARQQDARTLELRITLSLSRLLLQSGRQQEARQALAPICESFADCAETPDLTEARRLLAFDS